MKVIIEGSPADVRSTLTDPNAGRNEALLSFRIEALEKELVVAQDKLAAASRVVAAGDRLIATSEKKVSEAQSALHANKVEIGAKTAHIASLEAEVQKLQFSLREMENPVKMTPIQEAEIEAVFQDTLREYGIQPLVFSQGGKEISALFMLQTIFRVLASGDRVGAMKEIRACTGMSLIPARDLVDSALRAFGCRLNDKGFPLTTKGTPVKPLV